MCKAACCSAGYLEREKGIFRQGDVQDSVDFFQQNKAEMEGVKISQGKTDFPWGGQISQEKTDFLGEGRFPMGRADFQWGGQISQGEDRFSKGRINFPGDACHRHSKSCEIAMYLLVFWMFNFLRVLQCTKQKSRTS